MSMPRGLTWAGRCAAVSPPRRREPARDSARRGQGRAAPRNTQGSGQCHAAPRGQGRAAAHNTPQSGRAKHQQVTRARAQHTRHNTAPGGQGGARQHSTAPGSQATQHNTSSSEFECGQHTRRNTESQHNTPTTTTTTTLPPRPRRHPAPGTLPRRALSTLARPRKSPVRP